jgi:aryl-alcohol dehydrogenase-like predicted oxidoreductase
VQSEYSLLYRDVADETRETTRALGISFVAYAPLGRSLLAGVVPDLANLAPGDTRARHPRFEGENFARNRALVERVEAIAADKRCTVAQLCLAWLLAQGDDVIPIPGTKSIDRLKENLGTLDITLTAEEAAQIGEAIPVGAAAGTRYPAGGMKGVFI